LTKVIKCDSVQVKSYRIDLIMGGNILLSTIIFIIIILILGQVFIWDATIWTNIAIILGLIWSVFLINYREIIRSTEILFIEIAVRFLDCIAHLQGFKVQKADGHLLEEVYKLRHRVYLDSGIIQPRDHGLFLDQYDPFATTLVVMHNKKIISSLRITFYNKISKIPTLNYFNIDISEEDLNNYVDISRWVSDPEYRSKKKRNPVVTILLGLKMYLYLLKTKKRFILVTIKYKLKNHLEKLFNINFISPNIIPDKLEHKIARKEVGGYFEESSKVGVYVLEIKLRYLKSFFWRF
jgi:hypothetical protein